MGSPPAGTTPGVVNSFARVLGVRSRAAVIVVFAVVCGVVGNDADGLARVYQDVFSVEGTPGVVPTANLTYLNAAARLTNFACPKGPRKAKS